MEHFSYPTWLHVGLAVRLGEHPMRASFMVTKGWEVVVACIMVTNTASNGSHRKYAGKCSAPSRGFAQCSLTKILAVHADDQATTSALAQGVPNHVAD